jgi:nucleoside-diphosphate-sugar epimerase
MSTTAVVTGGSGWLGTRLLLALTHGLADVPQLGDPDPALRVRALALSDADAASVAAHSERIEAVRGDLRDASSLDALCAGAEGGVLFHCAGIVHPVRRTREFREVNVEGTRAMLEAAVRAGVRRAVVMSSNSPTGLNPNREHRFDEHSPYHPYMGYGRSKMEMEQLVAAVQEDGRIETVVVRAPWFYGPSQPARQTEFFSMIRRGAAPIVGGGENLRSMAYLDNLAQGMLLCAHDPAANGQTYWIADERPYSMNEIIDTIERLLEEEFGLEVAHRRLRLPGMFSELARLVDWTIQSAGLYQQKIHVLSEMNKDIACSIAKAKRELGYEPRVALEEGMRRSIRWCQDEGITI